MVLIGLMGTKGSGKTTAALHLVNAHSFTERSFADPLKECCQAIFCLADNQVYGTQADKETPDPRWFDITPRTIMQFVGTELFRNQLQALMPDLGSDIFTYSFRLWYEKLLASDPEANVVVSDVRFQNEVDFIHSMGGTVCRINRFTDVTDTHASEQELLQIKNYDYWIDNITDLAYLYASLDEIIELESVLQ